MAKFNYDKLTPEEKEILEKDPQMIKLNEKREELKKQLSQIEEQEKDRAAKAKSKARKARDHRVIKLGGLVEKYLGPVEEGSHLWDALEAYLPTILKNANSEEVLKKIAKNKGISTPLQTLIPEDKDEEESL